MKRLLIIYLFPICCLLSLRLSATMVTFQADLSALPSISPNGVYIMGSFNSWIPGTVPMNDVGNGHYTATLQFPPGSWIEYKYVNGNTFGSEESILGDCAFWTYHYMQIPLADTVLPWTCYGYCDAACTPATGMRIACVGNSITYGLGLPNNIFQSYPSVLQDSLGSSYLVTNFGVPGAAVLRNASNPFVFAPAYSHVVRYAPETILLMLGTNDSRWQVWDPYSSYFASDYDFLCTSLDTIASQPRMILCLPATLFCHAYGFNDSVLTHGILPVIEAQARRHAWDQLDIHGFTAGMVDLYLDSIHPGVQASDSLAGEVLRFLRMPRPQIQRVGSDLVAPLGWGWQWYYNGDTVATALGGQSQVLVAPPLGVYKVAVRVDSVLAHILVSDSLEVLVGLQAADTAGLEIFPNPVGDELHWRLTTTGAEGVGLRVWGLDGRMLMQADFAGQEGSLDMRGLPRNTYLVEIRSGEMTWRRVVVRGER